MEYHTGRLTITAEDVARWAIIALRHIRQRFTNHAPLISPPPDPASHLATAAHDELAAAHTLLAQGQIRAAGAVAGVALELHLKHLATAHKLDMRPYSTIAQVQATLRAAGLLTSAERKLINKLGAIRNQCVHARPELPSQTKVEKLIGGIERLMQAAGKESGNA